MRRLSLFVALPLAMGAVLVLQSRAQPALQSSVVGHGGASMTGASYTVVATVGQPTIGQCACPTHAGNLGFWFALGGAVTDVKSPESAAIPTEFKLEQNYPNPFNPTTTIQVIVGGVVAPQQNSGHAPSGSKGPVRGSVPPAAGRDLVPLERDGQWTVSSRVTLLVYDVLGRVVATLADGKYPAGRYTFTFDGTGRASGVYFYRLTAGSFVSTRSMVLAK